MDEKKKTNSLRKLYEKTAFGIAQRIIQKVWEDNRKIIYGDLIVTALLSLFVSGYMYHVFTFEDIPFLLYPFFGIKLLPLSLILFVMANYCTYRLIAMAYKETLVDEERNYNASDEGYKGTAIKMSEEQKEKTFSTGNYLTQLDVILGADPKNPDVLYSLKTNYGKNRNIAMIGAPGCGKSRCYAIPIIMQKIRLGESLIVTDPKGELYRDTAAIAKAHGYIVKLLDFRPEHSLHTDTCNYMGVVGKDTYKAQSFSKTVIDNTSDGKAADFWTESEFNLYIGACIMVNTNQIGIPKTMGGVYQLLNTYNVDEFEALCLQLEESHPAMPYLKTFLNGDKTVKGNTYAGLQIRLSALADPLVQNIVGKDDIDLSLPGKEKCIYYIASPDTDKSRSYLVALYFTLQYNQLINDADEEESGHLKIRVTMLLDEFANIGVIPSFPEKLSTVRSRWIDTIIILQDLGQLQKMYPEQEWEVILNDCTTRILICTNSILTSEYFSKLSGEQTTEEKSVRYNEKAGDLLNLHLEQQVTKSHGERPLYTPHEIRTLDPDHVLVFVSQCNVIELAKIDYENHPMCKEMRKWQPKYHLPKWILEMDEKNREKFGVYNQKYRKEEIDDIELCTDEDFMEPWTPEKKEALQKHIEESKKKKATRAQKNARTKSRKPPVSVNKAVTAQPKKSSSAGAYSVTATMSALGGMNNNTGVKRATTSIPSERVKPTAAPAQKTNSVKKASSDSVVSNTVLATMEPPDEPEEMLIADEFDPSVGFKESVMESVATMVDMPNDIDIPEIDAPEDIDIPSDIDIPDFSTSEELEFENLAKTDIDKKKFEKWTNTAADKGNK